jgi:hypothetical protein
MSDCLHCDINELVQQRLEGGSADVSDLASMIVESLAELILLVPESDQAKVIADTMAHFGQVFLEKSGDVAGGGSEATH